MKNVLQNKFIRWVFIFAFFLIATFLLLYIINLQRLDTRAFDKSAQALIKRSRDIQKEASPRYQGEVLSRLSPNPNNGVFFRLDDLLKKAVVREKPSVPFQSNVSGILFSFEFDAPSKSNLIPALGKSSLRIKDGVARIEHKNPDYLTNENPIEIPTHDIGEFVIRVRVNKGTRMILAWHQESTQKNLPSSQREELWRQQVQIDLIADTTFHTYVINAKNVVKGNLSINRKITKILLRPSLSDGVIVEIDFIRFLSTYAKYLRQINGNDYEVIGNEMRQVLYMLPSQTLEYSLKVPKRPAFLDFGTAILVNNKPVNFEVSITDNYRTAKLYSKKLTSSSEWHDVRLDLSPWGGKKVQLVFRVSGSQNNVAFWSNPLLSSEAKQRFNVIIILEDALRADHLSCNGYRLPTSPVKDKLFAKCGIVFDNAISQACWTRPSVPSLMTSLLPSVTGVWRFYDMLQDEFLTLAEIMRSQGFVTASFIQNPNAGPWAGMHQGFSQLIDSVTIGERTEGVFGDRLRDWLESHSHQNFFLHLHVLNPARRYDPPPPFDRWYREAPSGGKPVERAYMDPEWVEQPTEEGRRLLYDGQICHNDSLLPILLETLEALKIYQDTLLVFISDHGEHLGEHGLWSHREPGYIQTINVQFNLVYPARFHTSNKISQTVQLIDVMPTILELARVDTSNLLLQGDSLLDLIEGRRLSYWENRIVVSEETPEMSKTRKEPHLRGSLFFHNWHLISSPSFFKGSRRLPAFLRLEIFDFKNDRDEIRPVLSFLPDLFIKYKFMKVMRELQKNSIDAWKKWAGAPSETHKLDPDTQERLRSLGYIK